MKIAILASGRGSNFAALAKAAKKSNFKARIKLLITDKEKSFVRRRARRFKIKDIFINPKDFKSRQDFDKQLFKILSREKIDLILLAGYMRIVSPYLVKKYKNKILNIHPALLPRFRGKDAIARAFKKGCKTTGVTVHFVDEGVDTGPIILQKEVKIKNKETLAGLERRIHKLEHKLYPQALKLVVQKRLQVKGRNVKII
jgi:phosphoribosylglycinamide formyltransferase-1